MVGEVEPRVVEAEREVEGVVAELKCGGMKLSALCSCRRRVGEGATRHCTHSNRLAEGAQGKE